MSDEFLSQVRRATEASRKAEEFRLAREAEARAAAAEWVRRRDDAISVTVDLLEKAGRSPTLVHTSCTTERFDYRRDSLNSRHNTITVHWVRGEPDGRRAVWRAGIGRYSDRIWAIDADTLELVDLHEVRQVDGRLRVRRSSKRTWSEVKSDIETQSVPALCTCSSVGPEGMVYDCDGDGHMRAPDIPRLLAEWVAAQGLV